MRLALPLLFAVLPAQWFVVPVPGAGPQRAHLVAIGLFTVAVLALHRLRAVLPVVNRAWPFVVANVCLIAIWSAANVYHAVSLRQPFQEAVQLAAFVAVAVLVHRGARDPDTGILQAARWTALVCCSSLLVTLSYSMLANGVNPAAVFGQTLAQADPGILQRELFRTAFMNFGFDDEAVRGNIRHEVFGAVLTAMVLSAAAERRFPLRPRGARTLHRFSLALGATLLIVSLSRSVLLGAMAWPLLALVASLQRQRLSGRQLTALVVGVGALGLAGVGGFLSVLWVRFTQDTGSYEARGTLMDAALANIREHWLLGGIDVAGASAHNFVIDMWQRAGVFAALSALVVVVVLIGLWISLIARLGRAPAWLLPVTAGLALPVVRLFTAGGGVIPPVQWIALGVVAGFLTYHAWDVRHDPVQQAPGSRRRQPSPTGVATTGTQA